MSSMGELTFFLGLQVQQKKDGIFISQDKYVADILKKFDFATVKTASTPMEPNKALIKDEEADSVDVHLYRSMIGSLMYLTASRPDIMFAICACARFQVTPKMSHLHAVKRIFRYLKGQPKLGLWYPRDSPFDLEAFFDSDYAGASLDRKSTTGGCQFLGKRLISWQCKKQTIVANSTTEAEYVAAANCCGHVLWIQNQMLDYGFNFMNTKIFIDNESTICIVKNPVFHSKTKHIEIRHHFIRDCYEKKLIQVIKIHTDHNVADLLTKAFNFWNTAISKTLNSVNQIHAIVDGKVVVISESSVRSDLLFNDEDGIACLTNDEIFENLALMGYEQLSTKLTFQKGKVTPLFDSMLVQNQAPEGEGSTIPPEPQPTPSTSQPNVSEPQTESLQTKTPPTVSHELQTEAHIEQILPSPSTYQRKQRKTQKHRRAKQVTALPQTSVPLDHGADEAVHKEGVTVYHPPSILISLPLLPLGWQSQAPRNHGGALAQTRSERVLEKPNEPPLPEGHTSRSGEGSMEHTFELMDTVPPTPHDSPLTGGYTPGSDEGRLKLKELMAICIKLSKQVLDLEKEKDAKVVVDPQTKGKEQVESSDDDLDEEDASKQGRESDKTKSMFQDSNFDVLDDDMEDVEGETVHTATTGVSAVSAPVTTVGVAISTAEPRTPPTTAATAFIDEDLTIAQTLIKMKEEKAKEKGVAIKDVEDSPRPIRSITTLQPLPTIDPKDKGKGVLVEEEPEKPVKVKRRDQGQIEATSAALAEVFDEIQARIDVDHELAVRLTHEEQEKYTIEEREVWLAILEEERIDCSRKSRGNKGQTAYNQNAKQKAQKATRADSEEESSKKQKLEEDNDAEKEELIEIVANEMTRVLIMKVSWPIEILRFTRSQLQKVEGVFGLTSPNVKMLILKKLDD
ncbi:hypothetical protein Tco_0582766 [Tanacetum coccineum]